MQSNADSTRYGRFLRAIFAVSETCRIKTVGPAFSDPVHDMIGQSEAAGEGGRNGVQNMGRGRTLFHKEVHDKLFLGTIQGLGADARPGLFEKKGGWVII